jgi:transposase
VTAARAAWRAEFATGDPARLVFLDESGASTAMARRYGRARRGARGDAAVPHGHWKVVTLTAAVRLGGVGACLAFDGPTDAAGFATYVRDCLVPSLRPGDIVVMDNLACHKSAEVEELIRSAEAVVRYLPPYSPDLNPIEALFSKLKEYLRAAAARTVDALIGAMGGALEAVTPSDILGWFRHCGYHSDQAGTALERFPGDRSGSPGARSATGFFME